ncbi:hypothetical protein [Streptomyces sp. NPDC047976]|uniref:hypothetical protein n=1 Tax=Streptomyces sp. NPDC047976 TaxID=3155746 RepID=UPI00344825D8
MFAPLEPSGGGPLPDRGRRRNALNALLCTAGVAGVLLGGWALYDSHRSGQHRAESRTAIRQACADLADPDAVLRLDGGRDRVSADEDAYGHRLDLSDLPDLCELRSGRAGERDRPPYLTLKVHSLPQPGLHVLDPADEPVDPWAQGHPTEDVTDRIAAPLPAPLGDGRAGSHTARSVTVEAVCREDAAGVTSFRATATARYGEPTAGDRRALADIARTAAVRAAQRKGCETTPPELPADLPAPGRDLGPADRATGGCAWYAAHLHGRPDRKRLPDRALGTPPAERAAQESCVLVLGTDTRRGIRSELLAEGVRAGGPSDLLTNPWWLQTRAYFGDDADGTRVKPFTGGLHDIAAGQAGRENRVVYASATCGGRPAVFGMTTAYRYDQVLGPRLDEVFTAYATATAARHGCTGLVLPAPE